MIDFTMKIEVNPAAKEAEKTAKDPKGDSKPVKGDEKAPKSPDISFEVGDFCLVKRPADNNWRKEEPLSSC